MNNKKETWEEEVNRMRGVVKWFDDFGDFIAEKNLKLHDQACRHANKLESKRGKEE